MKMVGIFLGVGSFSLLPGCSLVLGEANPGSSLADRHPAEDSSDENTNGDHDAASATVAGDLVQPPAPSEASCDDDGSGCLQLDPVLLPEGQGELVVDEVLELNTDRCAASDLGSEEIAAAVVSQEGGLEVCVISMERLEVTASGSLIPRGAKGLILQTQDEAVINGTINVSADGPLPGPGGAPGGEADQDGAGRCAGRAGTGFSMHGFGEIQFASGGGGGGHGGRGGAGVQLFGVSLFGVGGEACAGEVPSFLVGGSGGAGGASGLLLDCGSNAGCWGGPGGGGGGALYLSAGSALTVGPTGFVLANGGGGRGGSFGAGGGGGGAGGSLVLEAPLVVVEGVIAANGGGGGGAGGAGESIEIGRPGSNGQANAQPAQGGQPVNNGTHGGRGGAGHQLDGTAAGTPTGMDNTGGGGGSAGRIHIFAETINLRSELGATISPVHVSGPVRTR